MNKFRDPEINEIVYIKSDVINPPSDCYPAYQLARRGDAVIVKEIRTSYVDKSKKIIYVHHPFITDNSFYVYRDEIMLTDPLLTYNEQKAYLKESNLKSLDERFRTSK